MNSTAFNNSTFNQRAANSGLAEGPAAASAADLASWKSPSLAQKKSYFRRDRRIRLQEIAEFTAQLSIMVRSGVDTATALGSLASQCQRPALAEVLRNVYQSVLAGCTLSDALRRQSHVFDAAFIATVAAGEASGAIADVLGQLAQMQRSELRNRRTMKTLMTYPVLLLLVSSSVIFGLVIFVLPRFAGIFAQYNVALPIVTQMLISFAAELQSRWWLWGPLVGVSVVGYLGWRSTSGGRQVLDAFWIKTPVIREVTRSRLTGRLCRLMGLMLANGVPILESLRLTRKALDNILFKALLQRMEEAVVNGRNLASSLQGAEIVPRSAREMIITAEATGNLGDVCRLLAEYYEEEAEARMRQLVGLIEPVLTVGMGAIVATVVLAVMLPVFDLSSLASNNH